jgi:Bacterioferritin (cytochrome b1)
VSNHRRETPDHREALPMYSTDDSGPGSTGFISDVQAIRARARQHMERGAVTPDYPEGRAQICQLLNQALATEIVCVLRYRKHYYSARGSAGKIAAAEFLEHANEEQVHADQIAARIAQLGGDPDFNPATLVSRSHSEYDQNESLRAMIEADLLAERIAIESYREMVRYFGDRDPTSRRLMEEILAKEEEHADDLVDLLHDLPATA